MSPPRTEDPLLSILAKLEESAKKDEDSRTILTEVQNKIESMDESLKKFATSHGELESWKPEIDTKVADLQNSVYDLKTKVDLFIHRLPKVPAEPPSDGAIRTLTSAHLEDPPLAAASGPIGHCDIIIHRGPGVGTGSTPVRGTNFLLPTSSFVQFGCSQDAGATFASIAHSLGANFPLVSFPIFDGSNPKLWKKRCETFFSFYSVPFDMWVKLATMHFDGPVVFWLQSMDNKVFYMTWEELGLALSNRFGRDQYNTLSRCFYRRFT